MARNIKWEGRFFFWDRPDLLERWRSGGGGVIEPNSDPSEEELLQKVVRTYSEWTACKQRPHTFDEQEAYWNRYVVARDTWDALCAGNKYRHGRRLRDAAMDLN